MIVLIIHHGTGAQLNARVGDAHQDSGRGHARSVRARGRGNEVPDHPSRSHRDAGDVHRGHVSAHVPNANAGVDGRGFP